MLLATASAALRLAAAVFLGTAHAFLLRAALAVTAAGAERLPDDSGNGFTRVGQNVYR